MSQEVPQSERPTLSLAKAVSLASLLAIAIAAVLLILTLLIAAFLLRQKFTTFVTAAGMTPAEFEQLIRNAWDKPVLQSNGHKHILLLGLDSLPNRGEAPPLTDTMMLISLNLETGRVSALSFPRDLWSEEYQTKINALYYYGSERTPEHPEAFPTAVMSDLAGIPIHHTIVLSLQDVASIIDQVGGVQVQVREGFTDTEFPRSDVDITVERDPAKLYKTVHFEQGLQLMSGETALEYIRSRHSQDDQGTDDARAARQQQVIEALMQKVLSASFLLDTQTVGELFLYYQDHFSQYFSVEEAIATAKSLYPVKDKIVFHHGSLPITSNDEDGVIYHPPVTRQQPQWVYQIENRDDFQAYIHQELGLK